MQGMEGTELDVLEEPNEDHRNQPSVRGNEWQEVMGTAVEVTGGF